MRRLVVALACLTLLLAGGACNKGKKKKKGGAPAQVTQAAPPQHPVKEWVSITVDEDGFHPSSIWAAVGKPITLTFTRQVEKTCNTTVLFPSEDIRRELPLNQPVRILLLPGHTGNIDFSCPSNKHAGRLMVQ